MQDRNINNRIGFRRPVLDGVSLDLQTRKLHDEECERIFDKWSDIVGTGSEKDRKAGALRKGDILYVYDMSYLGASFRRTLQMWREVLNIGAIIRFTNAKAQQYETWEEQDRWMKGLARNDGRYRRDSTKTARETRIRRGYKKKMETAKYLDALDRYLHREGKVRDVCAMIRHNGKLGIREATLYNWIDKITLHIANGNISYHGVSDNEWEHHLELRNIRKNKKGVYVKIDYKKLK